MQVTDLTRHSLLMDSIQERLLEDNPKAKIQGGYLRGIKCPQCGKYDAWGYLESLWAIICPHQNHCGAITKIREVYPNLFENLFQHHPPTESDPKATARAYLQSRRFNTALIEFNQGRVKRDHDGKYYPTVEILVQADPKTVFHRLIGVEGKGKTKIWGSYQGKVYQTKRKPVEEKYLVVESITDVWAIEQNSPQKAVATLSSSHIPKEYYDKTPHLIPILAFDGDEAGQKALATNIAYLRSKDRPFETLCLQKGKDWTDLQEMGILNEEAFKEAEWGGRLFNARSAKEYFRIYGEKHGFYTAVFAYKRQMYKGQGIESKKETEKREYQVTRIADCSINLLYSLVDDSIEYRNKAKYRLKLQSNREGVNVVELGSEELSNLAYFRTQLIHHQQLFRGNFHDLQDLVEYLLNKNAPKIRQCHRLGYDPKSNCFVFSGFLYDSDGHQHTVNHDNYFPKQQLAPFKEKTLTRYTEIDLKRFVDTLFQAFGHRGLLAFGFWIASLFSYPLFEGFGFFPFLSIYGDPHCGKSDLTKLMNRCFFIDWEGIPMNKANTQKGELRCLSQKSSLVSPLIEGRKDKCRFDHDGILPLYNRNPVQIRAKTTQDNATYEMEFMGTLAFVGNKEQFTSKPAKERVVSIHCVETDLNSESFAAWEQLMAYSPEELAFVGHSILQNRQFFEDKIVSEVKCLSSQIKECGIRMDRIAKNHAICFSGIRLFLEAFGMGFNQDLLNYTVDIAKTKLETAKSDFPLADLFFESVINLTPAQGYCVVGNEEHIHLSTALESMNTNWDKTKLLEELKQCDKFKCQKINRTFGERKRGWIFNLETR